MLRQSNNSQLIVGLLAFFGLIAFSHACFWGKPSDSGPPIPQEEGAESQCGCRNYGECVVDHGERYCRCPPGFFGVFCEIAARTNSSQAMARSCGNGLCPEADIDLIYLMDDSSSIGDDRARRMRDYVASSLACLPIDEGRARVGLIRFGTEARLVFNLGQYSTHDAVRQAVETMPFTGGTTATAKAIHRAYEVFRDAGYRPEARRVLVVVTDGKSNVPSQTRYEVRRIRHDLHVQVFSVGIGYYFDTNELEELASNPDSYYYRAIKTRTAISGRSQGYVSPLQEKLCEVSQCHPQCDDGFKCVNNECVCMEHGCDDAATTTAIPASTTPAPVTTTTTTTPATTTASTVSEFCTGSESDILLVIDHSSSVTTTNFEEFRTLMYHIVDQMDFGVDAQRLGIINFATSASLYLNFTTSRVEAESSVSQMRYTGGATYTHNAIDKARETLESSARSGVLRTVVFIIDGRSSNSAKTLNSAADLHAVTDVRVYVIGVEINPSNPLNQNELDAMTSNPTDRYLTKTNTFDGLPERTQDILDAVCAAGQCNPFCTPAQACVSSVCTDV